MSYIVTAPLLLTKKEDRSDLYLYAGSELPEYVSAEDVKRFETLGMVEKVDGRTTKSKTATSESN